MENCTIYSHDLAFEKVVDVVTSHLPKAIINTGNERLQKSLIATLKGGLFSKSKTLKINYRERKNPSYKLDQVECGLTQNLAGMANFVQSLPADNPELRNKFLYKVMAANSELAFIAEPELISDFEAILRKIAFELDAFIFAQSSPTFNKSNGQHFLDKNLNLILDTSGKSQVQDIEVKVDAKYHDQNKTAYTEEQLQRKEKSEAWLESNGIKVNRNLPCVGSSTTVSLRSRHEVIERVYALLIIAAKGEGVEQEYLIKAAEAKQIKDFSPKELYIYRADVLNDQERTYATWRYESLNTLLWALGIIDHLSYPSKICDVKNIVSKTFQPTREQFQSSINMRNKSTILDELDRTYRMNWACVDARIKGEEVGGTINPSIIYERHYALNWLTNYQNQEWDNVQTNT